MKGDGNERVLSYGDVLLRRLDVDLLLEPEFLNDRIIEFYFTFLSSDDQNASSLLMVSPSTSFWIMNCPDVQDLSPVLEPLELSARQLVLFPINNNEDVGYAGGGSHWSLFVYQRGRNVFLHFDSMNNANEDFARGLYKRAQSLLGASAANAPFRRAATPQQENGYDCGVYVMAIAKAIKAAFEDRRTDLVEAVKREVTPSSVAMLRRATFELIQSLSESQKQLHNL